MRGDLAECGTSAAHALRERLGLVIRTVWLAVLMFAVVVFSGTLGTVIAGQPTENPSLQYHLVFVVLPRFFRTFLVVLAAAWGAYRGSKASSLPLGPTVLGVMVLAGATFLVSQGLERSLVFGGLVPTDPGPDGFLVSAGDPRPLWFLSLVMMWPAVYILAETSRERRTRRAARV